MKFIRPIVAGLFISTLFSAPLCFAAEELITSAHYANGESIPYILNTINSEPQYVIILFPGGSGMVDPRMVDGKLIYGFKGNFIVRSRQFIVDQDFATVTTNSSESKERIQGLLDDLKTRFPKTKIYLMGTSRGTISTVALAPYLSGKIAGEIHTSSMKDIYFLETRKYSNRHLIVHHKNDDCHATPFTYAESSAKKHGTTLIVMDGGISTGDLCEPFAHHGFNGIEKETIDKIKAWVMQDAVAVVRTNMTPSN